MDFKELSLSPVVLRHPWEMARVEVIKKLIKRIFPHNKPLKVLEIGCGDLFVLECLAKEFPTWSFVGTDVAFPDSFMENYKHDRISIFKDSVDAIQKSKRNFDLVLLLDVVEHTPDDVYFLNEILNFPQITKDTYFLITVPAFPALFCSHDVLLAHYRRYTNRSLKKLFQQTGLKSFVSGYFFFCLIFPRVIRVCFEKFGWIKHSRGIGHWRFTRLGKALETILTIDFQLAYLLKRIGVNVPGLSNYAICKKSE